MILPSFIIQRLRLEALCLMLSRDPDKLIGPEGDTYLARWYVVPRNRFFNIYLHSIRRDDDDRALHDHPWASVSVLLSPKLSEIYKTRDGEKFRTFTKGQVVFRRAKFAHRLVLGDQWCALTLFITGPVIREWGFHCPKGWRPWRRFVSESNSGVPGKGCD